MMLLVWFGLEISDQAKRSECIRRISVSSFPDDSILVWFGLCRVRPCGLNQLEGYLLVAFLMMLLVWLGNIRTDPVV
jgi:hypothetical protein